MSVGLRRLLPAVTVAAGTAALYLYNAGAIGVLGPDEPRYVAIGRAMAATGDLVTPKLWGSPWFEKPPLLYWMTAIGTWACLPPDLCGRIPVILLSLAFLVATFFLLRREFGETAAMLTTVSIATCAGWLAYSGLALTDVPLAVCFSLAVWIALPIVGGDARNLRLRLALIGIAIGLGTLAKGLVPIALAAPFLWFLRRNWKQWWISIAAFLVVALPWYVAVYAQNGYPFVAEFFVRHHIERLYSKSLEHVQPWWYYAPVLLLGLIPWTPLLAANFRKGAWDERRKFLLAIVLFGFVFFSISLNKLPGYLLPLVPALLAVSCSRFELALKRWLLPCAVLMALIPLAGSLLPASLENGHLTWASIHAGKVQFFFIALPLAALLLTRRSWLPDVLLLCIVASGMLVKTEVGPVLNQHVSARGMWRTIAPIADQVCDAGMNRDWMYGLSFYANRLIRPCWQAPATYELRGRGHREPEVSKHQ